jgi:hypothetical protein
MNFANILSAIVTSAIVSGIAAFVLKTYLKSRIEHSYNVELAKQISVLLGTHARHRDVAARRMQGYPAIVELVYRTRNMARDLAADFSEVVNDFETPLLRY